MNPCPPFADAPERLREEYRDDVDGEYYTPHCSGKYLSGSGGHRVHARCDAEATWWHPDDSDAYCEEHCRPHDRVEYQKLWEAEATKGL